MQNIFFSLLLLLSGIYNINVFTSWKFFVPSYQNYFLSAFMDVKNPQIYIFACVCACLCVWMPQTEFLNSQGEVPYLLAALDMSSLKKFSASGLNKTSLSQILKLIKKCKIKPLIKSLIKCSASAQRSLSWGKEFNWRGLLYKLFLKRRCSWNGRYLMEGRSWKWGMILEIRGL